MSKRVVLSALLLLAGAPMLVGPTAPVGATLGLVAVGLLALPRLGRRADAAY